MRLGRLGRRRRNSGPAAAPPPPRWARSARTARPSRPDRGTAPGARRAVPGCVAGAAPAEWWPGPGATGSAPGQAARRRAWQGLATSSRAQHSGRIGRSILAQQPVPSAGPPLGCPPPPHHRRLLPHPLRSRGSHPPPPGPPHHRRQLPHPVAPPALARIAPPSSRSSAPPPAASPPPARDHADSCPPGPPPQRPHQVYNIRRDSFHILPPGDMSRAWAGCSQLLC